MARNPSKRNGERLQHMGGQFYQSQIDYVKSQKGAGFNAQLRAVVDKSMNADCAVEAIKYALENNSEDLDGIMLLSLWIDGDFESIRYNYPDAPESVFPQGGV